VGEKFTGISVDEKGKVWVLTLNRYLVAKQNRMYHLRTKENGYKELVVYRMKRE
jgi:hypothetical protein